MGLCKKLMKDRRKGNPIFGISGVEYGGEEASEWSLPTIATATVARRGRDTKLSPNWQPRYANQIRTWDLQTWSFIHYGMCSAKGVTVERNVHPVFMVDVVATGTRRDVEWSAPTIAKEDDSSPAPDGKKLETRCKKWVMGGLNQKHPEWHVDAQPQTHDANIPRAWAFDQEERKRDHSRASSKQQAPPSC